MLALAFKVPGEQLVCASCLQDMIPDGYPNLFLLLVRPRRVHSNDVCLKCGERYGRPECEKAIGRILECLEK
jgi:hypothetical protein